MKIKVMKGFTLIELLVVITIIGILATGAVQIFTAQLERARDSNRITDITALRWALEQAYQVNFRYPVATGTGFTTAVDPYLDDIPADVKQGENCVEGTTCFYAYNVGESWPGAVARSWFEISTAFESATNQTSRAAGNWDDTARLEMGINITWISTVVAEDVTDDACQVVADVLLVWEECN